MPLTNKQPGAAIPPRKAFPRPCLTRATHLRAFTIDEWNINYIRSAKQLVHLTLHVWCVVRWACTGTAKESKRRRRIAIEFL